VAPDRHAARLPFHLMVQNGWRRQNTLDRHYFRPGSTELTEAGKLKVKWILHEAPRHHRTIYVQVSDTPEDTAGRVAAVENLAVRLSPEGDLPSILQTNRGSAGWPASQVDAIGRKFESAIPDPVLREASQGGQTN
jgi:hypothetical protein